MSNKPIYKDLAQYYDLIYSGKDYENEVNKINSLIKKYKKSDGHDLLEVACGTGNHTLYLKNLFSILATDISKTMLSVAKKNIPDITFKQANMIQLDLGKKFDVILCLFTAIGYVKTYKNLNQTIKNFAQHLKKGGIVIIEPWTIKTQFREDIPFMATYDSKDIKIARLGVNKKRGILSIIDMHYLISERNQKTKYFVEKHELALFDINKVLNIMNKHGLKASFLKKGLMKNRGLYIGIKN